MKTFIITYDLKQPDRNYSSLYDAIKSLAGKDNWQHPLESVWIIHVSSNDITADTIFQLIHEQMDNDDSLFIAEISQQDRQGWLPQSFWEWMKEK